MANILDQTKSYLSHIDKNTSGFHPLTIFEQQTGLPRSYAVLAALAVYLVLIFLNIAGLGQLLSNIAGFVVPCYYSLIALETTSKDDDTALLTYWVVFAFLNVIEFWSRAILYWVPFYYLFKTVFLVYIAVPATGGAQLVYLNLIKPIAQKYVNKPVSASVSEVAEGVSSGVEI